jgi:hypothetical protein
MKNSKRAFSQKDFAFVGARIARPWAFPSLDNIGELGGLSGGLFDLVIGRLSCAGAQCAPLRNHTH